MLTSGSERRKHARVDFVKMVRVYPVGQATPKRYFAINLSSGGMFLHGSLPLERGRLLALEIDADKGPIRVEACQVVWERPFHGGGAGQTGIGVKFLHMSEDDRSRIDLLVDQVRPGSPAAPKPKKLPFRDESDSGLVIMLDAPRKDPDD